MAQRFRKCRRKYYLVTNSPMQQANTMEVAIEEAKKMKELWKSFEEV